MEGEGNNKPLLRVGAFTSVLMVATALIYDGFQALVDLITLGLLGWIINPLINFWSFMTFTFWFYLKGIRFVKPGKALTVGATTIIEFLPFLSDLPTWTAAVTVILAQTYAEDIVRQISPDSLQALNKVLNNSKRKTGSKSSEKERYDKSGENKDRTVEQKSSLKENNLESIRGEEGSEENNDSTIKRQVGGDIKEPNNKTAREKPETELQAQKRKDENWEERQKRWFERGAGYSEFDQKTGKMVSSNLDQDDSEDWPIAI